MSVLILALSAEGPTDERFLPIIVQRTAQALLLREGRTVTDVLQPFVLKPPHPPQGRAETILAIARQCTGYHALILHADADHDTPDRALRERIWPGRDLIISAHAKGEPVCDLPIPLVPVHMTEAWMLADGEALRMVLGTDLPSDLLGVPKRADELERDANPKQTLAGAITQALAARPQRRRRLDRADLDEPLARQIHLEHLSRLPSYRQFVADLRQALQHLHFIEQDAP